MERSNAYLVDVVKVRVFKLEWFEKTRNFYFVL